MKIYRLENKKGFGPYNAFAMDVTSCIINHNLPEDYDVICPSKKYFFGWKNKQKMKEFFNKEILNIVDSIDSFWKISVYSVEKKIVIFFLTVKLCLLKMKKI